MSSYSIIFVFLGSVMFVNSAFSDANPSYLNDTLTLPSVDSAEKPGAYQEVILQHIQEDEWQLLAGIVAGEIQEIERVEVIQVDSFPVQIFLKAIGTFSSGCPEVGLVSYQLLENKFEVFVYYLNNAHRSNPSEVACTSALVPFSKIIPIPVYSLKAGEYEYSVNGGYAGTFSLSVDNEL
ncbi:MAG: hypothetical protein COC19_06285 [SAR86 cluster bacterium]|uniref:Uncharacterized protein n=1 Tax=SAR86 cluster bacterium TaxID=2030880 RepID=A0A2A4MJY9_9GAMM|nr:MAG: hypothetical protein COC19_06285 [SAR86 cluster bacterium]